MSDTHDPGPQFLAIRPDGRAWLDRLPGGDLPVNDIQRLQRLQTTVEGYVEMIHGRLWAGADWAAFVNEDGIALQLQPNPDATRLAVAGNWPGDPHGGALRGTVVFVGEERDGDGSVPDDLVALAQQMGVVLGPPPGRIGIPTQTPAPAAAADDGARAPD